MDKDIRPNYPHLEPAGFMGPWREIHLYNITGWYDNEAIGGHGRIATAFSGYFKHDPSEEAKGLAEGTISDPQGQALLTGKFTPDEFVFEKFYYDNSHISTPPILYELRRSWNEAKNEWIGSYTFGRYLRSLPAEHAQYQGLHYRVWCLINKVHDDAFGIQVEPRHRVGRLMIDQAKKRFNHPQVNRDVPQMGF